MLLVDAMARALGLPQAGSGEVAYGVVDGFLVQVQLAERNGLTRIEVIVRYAGEGKEEELRRAPDDSPDVKASGIRFRHVQIDDTTATLGIFHEQLSFPEESVVLRRARAFLEVVKSVSAPEPATCRCCGSPSPEDPVLFGGVVDRVCPACIERLQHEEQLAAAEYQSRTANLPLGLVCAVLAGIVGGGLYGAVMIATNYMYWALAIVTGAMVGFAATVGAGKGGLAVQAIAMAVTIGSVLAGLLGFLAYQLDAQAGAAGATVDWRRFIAESPDLLLATPLSTLFSLCGGLIGAWTAIRLARHPKFADANPAQGASANGS